MDDTRQLGRAGADGGQRGLGLIWGTADAGRKIVGNGGGNYAARVPVEQQSAQLRLKGRDMARNGGLRQAKRARPR
jgi:hypothetical protein